MRNEELNKAFIRVAKHAEAGKFHLAALREFVQHEFQDRFAVTPTDNAFTLKFLDAEILFRIEVRTKPIELKGPRQPDLIPLNIESVIAAYLVERNRKQEDLELKALGDPARFTLQERSVIDQGEFIQSVLNALFALSPRFIP